jgi:hypothetical protein
MTKQIGTSTAISLSSLKLIRVACPGMILDASGKIKIFENAGMESTKFIMSKIMSSVVQTALPS